MSARVDSKEKDLGGGRANPHESGANGQRWTPGPWRTSNRYHPDLEVIDMAGFEVCTADDVAINAKWQQANPEKHWGSYKAFGSYRDIPEPEAEANARLIAAAPTMAEYIAKRADAGDEEAAQIWRSLHASR